MARNKTLHRRLMRGGKWQPSIADKHNLLTNDIVTLQDAVRHYSNMSPQTTSQFPYMTLSLFADILDDLDKRISAIEDSRPQHLNA